jgi:hypothetical protein
VTVSETKRWWGRGAASLDGLGLGLMVGSALIGVAVLPLAAVAFGISTSALTRRLGSSGAKRHALDPLEPRFDYDESLSFSAPSRVDISIEREELRPIAAALYEIDVVIAGLDVLARLESSWLGACRMTSMPRRPGTPRVSLSSRLSGIRSQDSEDLRASSSEFGCSPGLILPRLSRTGGKEEYRQWASAWEGAAYLHLRRPRWSRHTGPISSQKTGSACLPPKQSAL